MNDFETLHFIREFESFLYGGIPEGVDAVFQRDAHPFSESHSRGASIVRNSNSQESMGRLVVGRIEFDASTQTERMVLDLPDE